MRSLRDNVEFYLQICTSSSFSTVFQQTQLSKEVLQEELEVLSDYLLEAIKRDDVDTVEFLVNQGLDPSKPIKVRNLYNAFPLHFFWGEDLICFPPYFILFLYLGWENISRFEKTICE